MVDCLTDSCTDFSFAYIDTVGCARPLAGTLTASPAHADDYSCLTDLADFARRLDYLTEIHGGWGGTRHLSLVFFLEEYASQQRHRYRARLHPGRG